MKYFKNILNLKFASLLLVFLTIAATTVAQSFSASVNRNPVGLNDQFQLSFTLTGGGNNFKAPSLNDFMVLSGPNQSSSMQFINGSVSQSITLSYILQPKKEGTFKIEAASIESGGKIVLSNTLTINVTAGSGQSNKGNSGQSGDDKTNISSKNIFIRVSIDKTNVYRGEAIVATFKLYTNVQVVNYGINKIPAFNGFWNQDIEMPQQLKLYSEVFNGVNYQVGEIKKVVLYPQQSGALTIEPMEGECIARIQVKRNKSTSPFDIFNDPFFNDPFFGSGGIRDVKFAVKSEPIRINVKDLPPNPPTSFNGAVGKFSLEGIVDKTTAKTNDAINFRVKVSGKGNIKLIEAPQLDLSPDIEVYDPKLSDNVNVNERGASGTRTFEFLLIPRQQGSYDVGPVEFSYFDLDKKDYVTLKSPQYKLVIERGKDGGSSAFASSGQKDFKVIGRDIRFIKTNIPEFVGSSFEFYNSGYFYLLTLLPFAGMIGFALYRKRHLQLNADAVAVKSRKATKMARKRLEIANRFLKEGNQIAFYDETGKAVWGYLAAKLKIPIAVLNKETAIESLKTMQVSTDTITGIIETIDYCEYARFARMDSSKSADQLYNDAITLITKVENELKA
jgi:hypothetical protein